MLDAALLRPGRLDRLLYCGFPTARERLEVGLAPSLILLQHPHHAHRAWCWSEDTCPVTTTVELHAAHEAGTIVLLASACQMAIADIVA